MRHHAVFLLWRLATKIDAGYTMLIIKTLARQLAKTDATVQVEVPRRLAEYLNEWSEPVQIAFQEAPNGWQLGLRSCEQQVAIAETIRARAARQ